MDDSSSTGPEALGLVLKAAGFAAEKHRQQRRKDPEASPYINHPIAAASLLWHEGDVRDPIALVAALLHDTVEDTDATIEEIEAEFGPDIAKVVGEVTDDKSLPKEERKRLQVEHAPHVSRHAKLVKLADKICNVRDVAQSPPPNWTLERRQAYFDWARAVVNRVRDANPKLGEVFDAAYEQRPEE